jgi:hypothetical protein
VDEYADRRRHQDGRSQGSRCRDRSSVRTPRDQDDGDSKDAKRRERDQLELVVPMAQEHELQGHSNGSQDRQPQETAPQDGRRRGRDFGLSGRIEAGCRGAHG